MKQALEAWVDSTPLEDRIPTTEDESREIEPISTQLRDCLVAALNPIAAP